jgi:hypothetical protein
MNHVPSCPTPGAEAMLPSLGAGVSDAGVMPMLYHGTTRNMWRSKHESPSCLYLTTSLEGAERYATETSESEYESNRRTRIQVLRLTPHALARILQTPGVELQPDWGWVEAQEHDAKHNRGTFNDADCTWQNSLAQCKGLVISGFDNAHKKHFVDVDLESLPEHGM